MCATISRLLFLESSGLVVIPPESCLGLIFSSFYCCMKAFGLLCSMKLNLPFTSLEEKSFCKSFPTITEEDPLSLSSSGGELKKALQVPRVVAPKTGMNHLEKKVEVVNSGDGGRSEGEERGNGRLREGVCMYVVWLECARPSG